MSSKGHIIYSQIIECYHETNESNRDIMGKHLGFNIYFLVDNGQYTFEVKDGFMTLKTKHRTVKELVIDPSDLFEFYVDQDYLCLGIKGGSVAAKLLEGYYGTEEG